MNREMRFAVGNSEELLQKSVFFPAYGRCHRKYSIENPHGKKDHERNVGRNSVVRPYQSKI